jgi:hypothetical protein
LGLIREEIEARISVKISALGRDANSDAPRDSFSHISEKMAKMRRARAKGIEAWVLDYPEG